MKKHPLLFAALISFVLLAFLHVMGSELYIYWTMPWFDRMMHILGGFSIGLFALWIWWESGLFGRRKPSKKEAFLTALIVTMAIGIGWEMFEFAYGIVGTPGTETYLEDTFLDLASDFVGGCLAGIIGARAAFYSLSHE